MKQVFAILLASLFSFTTMASVDLTKSEVKWEGSKKIGDNHKGTVAFKSADLKVEKNAIKSGEFVVDMNTISATDVKDESKTKLDGHLKSADFFDVAKYPTAKFVIKSVAANKVTGDLTIKDKTETVTFDVKTDKKVSISTLEIDRTKFGVIYNSSNFVKNLGDKVINDTIKLEFKIVQL